MTRLDDIRKRCEEAYNWAINQNYPSVAAQYAKTLAQAVDELQAQLAAEKRRADAAIADLNMACKYSPCNSGICVKKNCTGNIIPCDFEWRGVKEETE